MQSISLYFKTIIYGVFGAILAGLFWYWFAILSGFTISLFGLLFGFAVSGMMSISLRYQRHIIYQISSTVVTFFAYLYTEYLLNRKIFSTRDLIDISDYPAIPSPYQLFNFSIEFYWGATLFGLLLALIPAWKNLGKLKAF